MDTNLQPQPETTVEEALSACPDLYTIFLRGKAECIGCFLQKFCTLREVTGAYRVPLEGFLAEVIEVRDDRAYRIRVSRVKPTP